LVDDVLATVVDEATVTVEHFELVLVELYRDLLFRSLDASRNVGRSHGLHSPDASTSKIVERDANSIADVISSKGGSDPEVT
jgi:hypothetical protein